MTIRSQLRTGTARVIRERETSQSGLLSDLAGCGKKGDLAADEQRGLAPNAVFRRLLVEFSPGPKAEP